MIRLVQSKKGKLLKEGALLLALLEKGTFNSLKELMEYGKSNFLLYHFTPKTPIQKQYNGEAWGGLTFWDRAENIKRVLKRLEFKKLIKITYIHPGYQTSITKKGIMFITNNNRK